MTIAFILAIFTLIALNKKRTSLILFLSLAIISDNPNESPGMGIYSGILSDLGSFFYTSVGPAKIFGAEAILLLHILYILFSRTPINVNRLSKQVKLLFILILLYELYGIATGGSIRFSMLQIRPIVFFCLLTITLSCTNLLSLKDAISIILVCSLYRALIGTNFWYFTLRNGVINGAEIGGGSYVLTHSDSVLMSISISIILMRILTGSKQKILCNLLLITPMIFFVVINNRRLAFIEIALSITISFFFLIPAHKIKVKRIAVFTAPLMVLYLIFSWNSNSFFAKPIQILRSSIEQKDASSATRGIENYNLIRTIKQRPILGWGFGHMYTEEVKAYSISHKFEAYRYVPHNSLLWLYCSGGIILPSMLVWCFILSLNRPSPHGSSRSLITHQLHHICPIAITTHIIQSFGDMGLQSWMGSVCVSLIMGTNQDTES